MRTIENGVHRDKLLAYQILVVEGYPFHLLRH